MWLFSYKATHIPPKLCPKKKAVETQHRKTFSVGYSVWKVTRRTSQRAEPGLRKNSGAVPSRMLIGPRISKMLLMETGQCIVQRYRTRCRNWITSGLSCWELAEYILLIIRRMSADVWVTRGATYSREYSCIFKRILNTLLIKGTQFYLRK